MSAPRRQVVNQPFGARPLSGGSSLRHSLQITRVMSSAPWSNLYRVGPRQLVFAGGTRHGVRVVDNRRRAHPAPAGGLGVGAVARGIAPAPMGQIRDRVNRLLGALRVHCTCAKDSAIGVSVSSFSLEPFTCLPYLCCISTMRMSLPATLQAAFARWGWMRPNPVSPSGGAITREKSAPVWMPLSASLAACGSPLASPFPAGVPVGLVAAVFLRFAMRVAPGGPRGARRVHRLSNIDS